MWSFITKKINQFFPSVQTASVPAAAGEGLPIGKGNKDGDRGYRKVGLKNTLLLFLIVALASYLLAMFVSGMFGSKSAVKPVTLQTSKAAGSQQPQTPASSLPDDYSGYPVNPKPQAAQAGARQAANPEAAVRVTPVTAAGQGQAPVYFGDSGTPAAGTAGAAQQEQEKNKWRSSALSFALAKPETASGTGAAAPAGQPEAAAAAAAYKMAAPNTILAGSVIPVSLITGINSDLSGNVVAQVRQDVYDSITGETLLIPQGARLIGEYEGQTKNGQSRIGVVFSRILFPDGHSLEIDRQRGTDNAGYPGLVDKVDNHSGRLVRAGVMTSLLAAAAQIAAGNTNTDNDDQTYGQLAVQGAATNVMEAGAKILERDMQITPTITIRPGTQFAVFINQDLVIPTYSQ